MSKSSKIVNISVSVVKHEQFSFRTKNVCIDSKIILVDTWGKFH